MPAHLFNLAGRWTKVHVLVEKCNQQRNEIRTLTLGRLPDFVEAGFYFFFMLLGLAGVTTKPACGQHLVEQQPERIDVSSRSIDPVEPFRCHVGWGAKHQRARLSLAGIKLSLGNTKIQDPHLSIASDLDV